MNRRRTPFGKIASLIETALSVSPMFSDAVRIHGKLESNHDGIYHQNYRFFVNDENVSTELTDKPLIARLLGSRHDWQRDAKAKAGLEQEAETLRRLSSCELSPYIVPRFVCDLVDQGERVGIVETCVPGIPIKNFSMFGFSETEAIQHVAACAATVHSLPPDKFDHLRQSENRKQHVLRSLGQIDDGVFETHPAATRARGFINDNLPPEKPGCVLHGDLLPQNIMCGYPRFANELNFDERKQHAQISIIDWQMAQVGDPAYDLAIITRGNKRIGKTRIGRKQLVDMYLEAGGGSITDSDVVAHELLLLLGWINNPIGHAPEIYAEQLAGFLRRI